MVRHENCCCESVGCTESVTYLSGEIMAHHVLVCSRIDTGTFMGIRPYCTLDAVRPRAVESLLLSGEAL